MDKDLLKRQILNRVEKLLNYPDMLGIYFQSKLMQKQLMQCYSRKSKAAGLDKLYFTISFDCDTEKDIQVIPNVIERLQVLNITPVMAVPGELLIKGEKTYKEIFSIGVEFLNHGYQTHSIKINTGYESILDYRDLSEERIRLDILNGDQTLKEILGKQVLGFRTPHFGNFQEKKQLNFLYTQLNRMGYKYSTSTIPYFGLKKGAAYKMHEIVELPVTGMVSEPLRILDSFFFYDNENDCLREQDYCRETTTFVEFYKENVECGLINIYADPSQIYQSEAFFDFMKVLNQIATNITYEKLLEEIK